MNSNVRPALARLIMILALVVVAAAPHGASASPQTDDWKAIESALLSGERGAYELARDAALRLPQSEFEALLESLDRARPVSRERIVSRALELRREQPKVAAEFDRMVQKAIEDAPKLGAGYRRPRDIYIAWWPRERPELDPLAFELMTVREVHRELSDAYMQVMDHRGLDSIEPTLQVARDFGLRHVSKISVNSEQLRSLPDERQRNIVAALTEIHMRHRNEFNYSAECIRVLQLSKPELARPALEEIRVFEESEMEKVGFKPWNDSAESCRLRLRRISEEIAEIRERQLDAARQGSTDGHLRGTLEQQYQNAHAKMIEALNQQKAQATWDALAEAIQSVSDD